GRAVARVRLVRRLEHALVAGPEERLGPVGALNGRRGGDADFVAVGDALLEQDAALGAGLGAGGKGGEREGAKREGGRREGGKREGDEGREAVAHGVGGRARGRRAPETTGSPCRFLTRR